jgi:sigma-E factor negative regulatory protein RseB
VSFARGADNLRRVIAWAWLPMVAAVGLQSGALAAPPQLPAQATVGPTPVVKPAPPELDLNQWLLRMHNASSRKAYVGTFVVMSAAGGMYSSRIWHVCDGDVQMERIDALTGPPRSTLRRNDQVITFLPELRVARAEKRGGDPALANLYQASAQGVDRVAGFDADVVLIQPKDAQRFGYRIWSERKSGLVVKIQTLDAEGRVLEQAAFSELDLEANVKMEKLAQMMAATNGYRVEHPDLSKTTSQQEGWTLKGPVAGFQTVSCYRRGMAAAPTVGPKGAPEPTLQWTFSDGLATVSLFIEPYDRQPRAADEVHLSMGATQTLGKRVLGDWWVTLVGEVPAQTLKLFAQNLERLK